MSRAWSVSGTFPASAEHPGEVAEVEVAADVAPRVGASAGTTLLPVPGVLPHEILEVPAAWLDRHAQRRRQSTPYLPAQG